MRRPTASRAFTLIELMLAIAIAIFVLVTALPSMRGLSAEKRLRETFDRFDELARKAQLNAVSQQRSWTLIWQEGLISLQPDDPTPEERLAGGEGLREDFPFGEDLDPLGFDLHRRSDHLTCDLRTRGKRPEQQVSRAGNGLGALAAAGGQRYPRRVGLLSIALLYRALAISQLTDLSPFPNGARPLIDCVEFEPRWLG